MPNHRFRFRKRICLLGLFMSSRSPYFSRCAKKVPSSFPAKRLHFFFSCVHFSSPSPHFPRFCHTTFCMLPVLAIEDAPLWFFTAKPTSPPPDLATTHGSFLLHDDPAGAFLLVPALQLLQLKALYPLSPLSLFRIPADSSVVVSVLFLLSSAAFVR